MRNKLMDLFEAFKLLEQINLEESAKTDFINKFGQDTFDNFVKAKDRLVNKGYSVDFGQYLKMSKKEVDDLILSLYDNVKDAQKKRIIQGTDKEIRGKYRDLGIKNGFHVYEPLDVYASMDLGVNTGWCTTGRYGHYGHPEFTPSLEDAKQHWNDYTQRGIRFFYLLDPETMYGEYAIALYPNIFGNRSIEVGRYGIKRTNIEIYNDEDDLDYTLCTELDLSDIIDKKIVCEVDILDEVEIRDNVLVKYRGSDHSFKIPGEVTSIGDWAFADCASITSITIPNSVKSIGEWAFSGCDGLTSMTIPDSVISIENRAFDHCHGLTSVTIGNGVTSIGWGAFADCTSLTSITIPDSVTSIGECAFSGCDGLTSVTIPNSVSSIGRYTFSNCTVLVGITIPNSVKSIGNYAFGWCSGLESITIPDSVTSIGEGAFFNCTWLKSVTIPDSVKSIGDDAFFNCTRLTSIMYSGSNSEIIKKLSEYADVVNPETGEILS